MPRYEADGSQVTLHIYDGTFDHAMASLVARWHGEGKDIGLDGLIVLTYLKDHRFISTTDAAVLLQLDRDEAIAVLDTMSHPTKGGFLSERDMQNRQPIILQNQSQMISLEKLYIQLPRGLMLPGMQSWSGYLSRIMDQ